MLEIITSINKVLYDFIWGVPAMVCIIGVGLYVSFRTGFLQLRKFGYSMKNTVGRIFKKEGVTKTAVPVIVGGVSLVNPYEVRIIPAAFIIAVL